MKYQFLKCVKPIDKAIKTVRYYLCFDPLTDDPKTVRIFFDGNYPICGGFAQEFEEKKGIDPKTNPLYNRT